MIILVTELFYPDEISTAPIMKEIAEHFAKQGKVKVIAGPVGYDKNYNIHYSDDLHENIEIQRVRIPSLDKNKLIPRISRLVLLSLKLSYRILRNAGSTDHVIIVTNPAFLLLLSPYLKKLKKFKLSIIVHDVFPENVIPTGMMKKDSRRYRFLKRLYDNAYNKADNLIVLGDDMRELLASKTDNSALSFHVIPNWADDAISTVLDFNRSEYLGVEVEDKIVIGFAGNLGRLQGLTDFVEVWKKINNPYIILVLIGDGAVKPEIEKLIQTEEVKNVYLLGPKPRAEQNKFLNSFDIGLVSLSSGMFGLGVPSKTYNIMAAAKPILFLGDPKSEIDNYINTYDCGWSFDRKDSSGLKGFLETLNPNNREDYRSKGVNGQKAVKDNFTKDKVLPLFNHVK